MQTMGLHEIAKMAKDPIRIKSSRKGLLHKKLHVPEGKKIPEKDIEKAKQSDSPALRKEAVFAQNMKPAAAWRR